MKVALVGNNSLSETIKAITTNIQGSTTTMFKDVETGELSTEIPTNKMFEIVNVLRDEEPKSGREKRRERRKQQMEEELNVGKEYL